ncbi:MAG: histidinol-phosphate aminotransferase family protein [Deltaproteobacteria bacterium]|jgi:histidinol-phosphate aminotransferase|nr:histidinol-phosphate aminotransferase family protein [Deltaproteobacteria bacterium]
MGAPKYLRPDLPAAYPFTVREQPWVAKLDQNEAPVDLPAELKRELALELADRPWNRYVQPAEYQEAKRALAEAVGVDADNLAITAGADQGLAAAAAIAGGPGRKIRWFEPTYPYVGHVSRMSRGDCQPLELGPNIDAEVSAENVGAARLVFFVSPNNPTGGLVDREVVRKALQDPGRLVVVDEAYYEYSRVTVADLLEDFSNLLVVRSLSKSLLAAAHVGYVLGSEPTIASIDRMFTAPYNLTAQQLQIARRYGQIRPHVIGVAELVRRERDRVSAALEASERVGRVYPSAANFVLFEVNGEVADVAAQLTDRGIRIRNVSGLAGLEGHLRVTIGSREDNDRFIEALDH